MTLLQRFGATLFGLAVIFAAAQGAHAEEQVGKAISIVTSVTGAGGPLSVGSPVHRNERLRSSKTGVGQFMFRDGTKLALGPNSSIVIDRYVFDDSSKVRNFTLNATRGTFRWISGRSDSSSYKIKTPVGTMGVRGTAFDVYVGPRSTAVILLSGEASFCSTNGGCKKLTRKCEVVVADASGLKGLNPKDEPPESVVRGVRNEQSFPFATGDKDLTRPFRVGNTNCGVLRTQARNKKSQTDSDIEDQRRTDEKSSGGPGNSNPGGDGDGDGGNDNGPD